MKYMIGLKINDSSLVDYVIANKQHIYEVYFSWGSFPNGRSNQLMSDVFAPWELQNIQQDALHKLAVAGIPLNILFNANCYGADSQSRAFFDRVGTAIDYVYNTFGLSSVTTTSPLIAKFVKNNFEQLEVRASVNMEIGTVEAMEYISQYFDGYYMKREFNRNFEVIRNLSDYCKSNGKKLYMLANSGCLNNCPVHNFHDNLVAHESEIAARDNAYNFGGICKEYLRDEKNYAALMNNTNFVRPEDIYKYESYFEAVKLATRVHRSPVLVAESYINGKYSGNILDILEPAHSIYPYVIENGEPLKLKKIDTDIAEFINVEDA